MSIKQPYLDTFESTSNLMACRRRSWLAAVSLMPLLWLTGCTSAQPLVLAGHPWPGYEPMFLARDLGYLPQGLLLLETPTVQASIDAVKQGRADGAMLTMDEVLLLRAQGTALQIVLVFDVSKGADALLTRPGIDKLGALKGKRLGAEDSALGTLMLMMVLEKAGLAMGDITLKRVAYEDHEAAWGRGEVDALVTYEPVAGRLKSSGALQLLSTRELPDTIFDVLAVKPEAAQAHADSLRSALAGHFRALAHMKQNPWDAAYRVAPRLGVSAEEMIASLRGLELPDIVGNQRYLSGRQGELLRIAQKLSPIMQQARLIDAPVDPSQLYSNAYLPKALP
jgi:NitT/TauT family transport system substrate-binding protein